MRQTTPLKTNQRSEKEISKAVVNFLETLKQTGRLTYYVNLEGARRDVRQQVAMKQQGARAGRPDIEIFANDNRVIFLELKRRAGGRLSEHQKKEIEELQTLGFECHVIRATDGGDAISQIQSIL